MRNEVEPATSSPPVRRLLDPGSQRAFQKGSRTRACRVAHVHRKEGRLVGDSGQLWQGREGRAAGRAVGVGECFD